MVVQTTDIKIVRREMRGDTDTNEQFNTLVNIKTFIFFRKVYCTELLTTTIDHGTKKLRLGKISYGATLDCMRSPPHSEMSK